MKLIKIQSLFGALALAALVFNNASQGVSPEWRLLKGILRWFL